MRRFRLQRVTRDDVRGLLDTWVPRGVRAVHFTGGEPTLHRELADILLDCRRRSLHTGIGTNGWRLADAAYAARVLPLLDEAMLSLHGPDATTHDALTGRPGSFDRVMRALSHLRGPGVNIVVTRDSLASVAATASLAVARGARFLLVSAVAPEGEADRHYRALAVPLRAVAAMAEGVLRAVGDALPVRFFGLPACALGGARVRSNDLYWSPRVTVEWALQEGRPSLTPIVSERPDRGRAPVTACASCLWRGSCPGPFVRYVAEFGDQEIVPIGVSSRGCMPAQP